MAYHVWLINKADMRHRRINILVALLLYGFSNIICHIRFKLRDRKGQKQSRSYSKTNPSCHILKLKDRGEPKIGKTAIASDMKNMLPTYLVSTSMWGHTSSVSTTWEQTKQKMSHGIRNMYLEDLKKSLMHYLKNSVNREELIAYNDHHGSKS